MGQYVICLSVFVLVLCELSWSEEYYTNQWAVHVEGGLDVARRLADRHGFTFVDTVQQLLFCAVKALLALSQKFPTRMLEIVIYA